jgi:hypothetical protein
MLYLMGMLSSGPIIALTLAYAVAEIGHSLVMFDELGALQEIHKEMTYAQKSDRFKEE